MTRRLALRRRRVGPVPSLLVSRSGYRFLQRAGLNFPGLGTSFPARASTIPRWGRVGDALMCWFGHPVAIRKRGKLGAPVRWSSAAVRYRSGSDKLCLIVVLEEFEYRETVLGHANLTLVGRSMPESLCHAFSTGDRPLSSLIDSRRFFMDGDPLILAVRNSTCRGGRSLTVRLAVDFQSAATHQAEADRN